MAAQNGTAKFQDLKTKEDYIVDVYFPDAVSTICTFNPQGLSASTSPEYWKVPNNGVIFKEIVLATAPTAVGAVITLSGNKLNNFALRYAEVLVALNNRLTFNVVIPGGEQFGLLQY